VSVLGDVRIDATTKGWPAIEAPVALADVAGAGWMLEDLRLPTMVLRRSALEHNVALMRSYCRERGVALAPHGKTTMAPQLWSMQLEAGAWGITAATVQQAAVMRAVGVDRILIANEVTDARAIEWLAADTAAAAGDRAAVTCYVDSIGGVRTLAAALGEGPPQPVLVELGFEGGRTGCRTIDGALEVAEAVTRAPRLLLAGVAAYEGTLRHDRQASSLDAVRGFLATVRELVDRLVERGALGARAMVTAGGSLYFDLVVDELGDRDDGVGLLLRSGCYLTHDTGVYERSSPFAGQPDGRRFRSAMEAYGAVLSAPEPRLALVGLGRRDVPWDQGMPRPLRARTAAGEVDLDGAAEIVDLNDQHAYVRLERDRSVAPGDRVRFGISHPCTAFDRWRVLPVLDDADRVVDGVATFF
jgi:D-serine deaminase-like pyridoxal phosphate-dependent protein